ncbi:MAG: PA4642 family protein [Gammaproteobacteria bacterium]
MNTAAKEGKKRGAERTQIATRNEEWSDDRLKAFLDLEPPEHLPADYNILLKAYRGMTEELFSRFLPIFVDAGHDINVKLEDGSTFLDLVSQHRKSSDYAEALQAAGAKKSS